MSVNEVMALIFCIVMFIMVNKLDKALKSSYSTESKTLKDNK